MWWQIWYNDSRFPVTGEKVIATLQWRHNERDGVSHHWRIYRLLKILFMHRSKKTPKLRVTGLCEGNPPVSGGFPSLRDSNLEDVSIWWLIMEISKVQYRDLTLEAWRKSGTLQTIFSNAYSCMKIVIFWFKFHWNLFPVVQFTIRWFGQWLDAAQWWRIYASPGLLALRW